MTVSELIILLVEDNPGDVYLVREALAETGIAHRLHRVEDGQSAIEFLEENRHNGMPDLVILDLNLPRKNGRQVLAEMQRSDRLRDIPVAVFTTSRSEIGIVREFPLIRSTFAAKTADFGELVEIMRQFQEFARAS
ncbi:MAG: response regulator [Acidobacteria bacterium]|nr:response regulator [Acidobacteriota bacterium]